MRACVIVRAPDCPHSCASRHDATGRPGPVTGVLLVEARRGKIVSQRSY
ncbi:MAG: hypothetical protein IPO81_17550 [Kouleothrix sp.]|nr:hypothetical protein [Kouleothrix sp.]